MSRKFFISNNLANIHAFYDLESTSLLLGVRKRIEDNELPKTRFACARAVVILIERAKFTHSAHENRSGPSLALSRHFHSRKRAISLSTFCRVC